jgi:GntR family transcriptional regulator
MFFSIDPSDGLAIYDQIVRQVKFAIAAGALARGELVPSVRELAKELAINPNTVARAYRQLQDDGVLFSVRGTGLEVAEGAVRRCRGQRVELIRARLRQVLAEARQSGLAPAELRELIDREIAALEKLAPPNAAAEESPNGPTEKGPVAAGHVPLNQSAES